SRELHLALVKRWFELEQQHRALDVQDPGHERSTLAGVQSAARVPIETKRCRFLTPSAPLAYRRPACPPPVLRVQLDPQEGSRCWAAGASGPAVRQLSQSR